MAHEILDNYCVFSLNSEVGGVPWHRIGTGLDIVTGGDVLTLAGFDRTIATLPIGLAGGGILQADLANNLATTIDGYRATVDLKHGRVLGVVTDQFTVVQPAELLSAAEFLCNEVGAVISCAATIRDGKREFISLAMPDSTLTARDGDTVKRFFNLAQGHDGTVAMSVGSSAVRVVCANTLAAFIGEGKATKIRHRTGIHAALARAVAVYGSGAAVQEQFYQALAGRKVLPTEVIAYYEALTSESSSEWRIPARGRKSLGTKIANLLDSPERADGIEWQDAALPATAWDVYNVATQVITHESTSRDPLNNLLWGSGHAHLQRAETLASQMFLSV